MKKIYSFILLAFAGLAMQAQNAIPNGNFESWTSGTFDMPTGYWGSNASSFFRTSAPFNVVKTTDAYHGNYAVQLTTNVGAHNDTNTAYIVNSPNTNGNNPCQWSGGTPLTQIPTGIRGYYKCSVTPGDTAGILVAFKNGSTCLGMYLYKFYGVHSTYTQFSFLFSPAISGTPDSMVFAAVSSDVFNNIQKNGSMLQLDSISFTGIATQPASFDGDFENWTSVTVNKPNSWYLQTNDQGAGILQTTDKKAGTYAMELKTFLGDRGNGSVKIPAAESAGISTGYYPQNCSGVCNQKGGWPFSNQTDTLCFYYKYAPVNNDTASASINFKYGGNNVWGTGVNIYGTASTYQYKEIPFNTMNPIDTAIVSFQSTNWRDSATTFVGSDFKIDEVHFKSQPLNTGIKLYDASVGMKVFPNPSNDGNFVVSNVGYYDLVRVMNVYGQEVSAEIKKVNGIAQIHVATPGAYSVFINSQGITTTLKVIVSKE